MPNKEMQYRQCCLTKRVSKAVAYSQVSWIPEKFAIVGKILKLKNTAGKWDDGWKVVSASKTLRAESLLPDFHSEIKDHLKTTGDSRPKRK